MNFQSSIIQWKLQVNQMNALESTRKKKKKKFLKRLFLLSQVVWLYKHSHMCFFRIQKNKI